MGEDGVSIESVSLRDKVAALSGETLVADLSQAILKIGRAKKHLDALEQDISAFCNSQPYSAFASQPDPQSAKRLLCARINRPIPADDWSLTLGDFAHNARSALNFIVESISGLSVSDPDRSSLQFPVLSKAPSKADLKKWLNGVATTNVTMIEALQPYNSVNPAADPLFLLSKINNMDKHRLMVFVGSIANVSSVSLEARRSADGNSRDGLGPFAGLSFSHGVEVNSGIYSYRPIGDGTVNHDGAAIGEMEFADPSNVDVNAEFSVEVKFGPVCPEVNGLPVLNTLTLIHDRVEETIRKF